ncbi:micrococcal nuclease-like nuclease [Desulfocurvibacter africanus PCS]|uniref:Micrococcal nuclease-like nuclease n=1 Tax=Desulfocurvibacter africanus PCS TaxID=1262666 RepID=M5PQ51_DESAF|nr:micrococcal nuclease-like nuclease [Desulfocurvibacter africanus PCS]
MADEAHGYNRPSMNGTSPSSSPRASRTRIASSLERTNPAISWGRICSFLLAWEGYVIQVHDGDTITVMDPERGRVKIQLYGIDCPELDQPGGSKASGFAYMLMLRQMVEGETVDVDRYGREVALVRVKGADVSTTLVRAGHAWVYGRYCLRDECDTWEKLEKKARQDKLGLWAEDKPVPPWKWRRRM